MKELRDAKPNTYKSIVVPVTMFVNDGVQTVEREVVYEMPFTIFLNGRELLTTLCTPVDLEYLAAGILVSEGLVTSRSDIKSIEIDADKEAVFIQSTVDVQEQCQKSFKPLIASGGGKGSSSFNLKSVLKGSVNSKLTISVTQALNLIDIFFAVSSIYENTHGVHGAALCDPNGITLFKDDIGRHNALDKIFGECFLKDILLTDSIILTSGRISSEIILKVGKRGIPILISKSPPTNQGVSLAEDIGITLIQVTKDKTLLVYSHVERIISSN